jgi:hypothetical protein
MTKALKERSSHDGLAILSGHHSLTNVGPDFVLLRPEYFLPYLGRPLHTGDPGNIPLDGAERDSLEATLRSLLEGS